MPGLHTLALSVVAGHGARAETPRQSGWAHLLEHMVFKGAGARSAMQIVADIEAQGGQLNAATGYERTSYYLRALKGGLPLGLEIVSDLMLRPTLDPGELTREKRVIAQEIAEAQDSPDDVVFELAQSAAFPGQALGRPILGSVKSLAAAEPESLEGWRAAIYAPERLVISAAGAVDEAELLALSEQWFGAAAAAPSPAIEPGRFAGGLKPKAKALEQANLVLLLPAPGQTDPDYFALRLLAEALGGGMASRLFQEARERRGLAYAIDAYAETYSDTGVLGVFAGCAAEDAEELARVTAGEILKLADAIGEDELARAKAQQKAGLFFALESPAARADAAAAQVLLFGRSIPAAELEGAVDAVTPADIARVAQRVLEPRKLAVAVLGPRRSLAAAETFERTLFG
ncbi:MAG TPA: pitrilysin family protein [Caulobacteraceae bacterium]